MVCVAMPPLPAALRIGVTGHRSHRIADPTLIQACAAEVLAQVCASVAAVVAVGGSAFSMSPPRLRLVSCCADGADLILAEAAIVAGFRLDMILPFAAELYTRVFPPNDRDRVLSLSRDLATASVLVLEDAGDPPDPLRINAAYLAAGRLMLDHLDILVTVWDGLPQRGGGRHCADGRRGP